MKKLLIALVALVAGMLCGLCASAQTVAVTADTGYVRVSASGTNMYIKKQLVDVETQMNDVIIRWSTTKYVQYPYTAFTTPSGGSAIIVANKIALYLNK